MTNCTPEQLRFPTIDGLTVRADFDGGALSSDFGTLLLRGVDRQIGLAAHNRPSGVAEPSQSDIEITNKLKSALELLEIRVLDRIIVGGVISYSMATSGSF